MTLTPSRVPVTARSPALGKAKVVGVTSIVGLISRSSYQATTLVSTDSLVTLGENHLISIKLTNKK